MAAKNTKEEFINSANIIHNFKYKYVGEYINNKTKIEIFCPEHGSFWQRPDNHLHSKCPKCGEVSRRKNKTLTI